MTTLTELYHHSGLLLTAHRGASFENAENTLPAFESAIAAGAHFIEFDLFISKDGVPVVLHDKTIDRTSNGSGRPEDLLLKELRQYNFTYYHHGEQHKDPQYPGVTLPTFEEVLEHFHDKVCMNIQLNGKPDDEGIAEICRLYKMFDMVDRGFLTIAWQDTFDAVRSFSPDIEICFTPPMAERATAESLELCAAMGCRFVQPVRGYISEETFDICRRLNLRANIFYSDDPAEVRQFQAMGADSVLTNKIELLASELL